MGEEGNRELESELATLEEELEEYLKKLEKFEEIIEKGLEEKFKIKSLNFTSLGRIFNF
jgi:predicted RNase H-like nuclease (RuvC/YqgF family)